MNLLGWLLVLMSLNLWGLGLGLAVSAVAWPEELVVAAIPILVLPQIFVSAVTTGDINPIKTDLRGFPPIVVCLTHAGKRSTHTPRIRCVTKVGRCQRWEKSHTRFRSSATAAPGFRC